MTATPSTRIVALDPVALERLRSLDPEGRNGVLPRVLQAFETSLVRLMGELGAARASGDAAPVMSTAHTLKSSAAYVGALELSALCAELERELREGRTENLVARIDAMVAAAEGALVSVRAMLAASPR